MSPYRIPPPREPRAFSWKRVVLAAPWAVILVSVVAPTPACTPAARQDVALAAGVLAGVASSPVPCLITKVAASGGGATLCGEVSSDVSDVAKLVEDILLSLPATPAGMKGEEPAPVQMAVRGKRGSTVTVTLSPVAAESLQRKLTEMASSGADAGNGP